MSEEVLACRVCLATEVKLYNMHQNQLVTAYETVAGTKISITDGLPNRTCSFCSTLLLKYAAFQKQCVGAQDLLHAAVMQNNLITASYINSIDRETHNLTLPYGVKVNLPFEVTFDTVTDIFDVESNSNKRPLSNANKKTIKRHKKKKSNKNSDLNNVNVKIENAYDSDDPTEDLNNDMIDNTSKEYLYKQGALLEEDFEMISSIKQEDNHGTNVNTKEKLKLEDSDEERPLSEISKKPNKKDTDFEMDDLTDEVYTDDDVEVLTLSKQEQIDEILARKETANYKNSYFKCDVCYKGFITEITLKNHMERHDPRSGDYVCEICGSRWPNAKTLRAHEQTSHVRRYKCKMCEHVSKSSFKAREHSQWHKGIQYICNVCGASFAKSTSHLTHMRLRHGGGTQCGLCGAKLLGECGLNMHMRIAHRFQEKQKTLHCSTCKTTFKTPDAYTAHSVSSGESGSCTELQWCVHCGSGFDSCMWLKLHAKEHLEVSACGLCDKHFFSARTLAQHRARVHGGVVRARGGAGGGERAARAQLCVCEVCGHTCTSKATLVSHLRTHTGEKPYQCAECPKRFSVYQRLRIHIRTHTGERPYKCDYCPKGFKHKAALNRHHRVHTGAKPYQCPHCGKAFSQSNSMKGHVNTVHLKIPPPPRNRKRVE